MIVTRLLMWHALAVLIVLSLTVTARAESLSVVVSVMPLHAIVAAVMKGGAPPRLLVKGGASPHDYALRQSDSAALNDDDLVVWVGEAFELFLTKPLEALAEKARVVTLEEFVGNGENPHIWLDPDNAREIARRVVEALSDLDPHNRDRYETNAAGFSERLETLDEALRAILATVAHEPYLVFHDAYGAFERRYGLTIVGSVTINPQQKPGVKRIVALRETIRETGARCLFGEPQFTPALLDTLIEGGEARIAILDPLGATLTPGPEAYFTLMRNLAEGLRDCLAAD